MGLPYLCTRCLKQFETSYQLRTHSPCHPGDKILLDDTVEVLAKTTALKNEKLEDENADLKRQLAELEAKGPSEEEKVSEEELEKPAPETESKASESEEEEL